MPIKRLKSNSKGPTTTTFLGNPVVDKIIRTAINDQQQTRSKLL